MRKKDFMADMSGRFSRMSKSQKAIASYISDHYDEAVFMTAAKLGEALHISESTVVRFALMLGYEGYPEFQKALEGWVKDQLTSVQRMGVKYAGSTQSEVLTSVLQSDMDKIRDTIEHLDPSAFDTAVDIILKAKKVYISGIRSCEPLADFLWWRCTGTGLCKSPFPWRSRPAFSKSSGFSKNHLQSLFWTGPGMVIHGR